MIAQICDCSGANDGSCKCSSAETKTFNCLTWHSMGSMTISSGKQTAKGVRFLLPDGRTGDGLSSIHSMTTWAERRACMCVFRQVLD